jgi:hypothetical protein
VCCGRVTQERRTSDEEDEGEAGGARQGKGEAGESSRQVWGQQNSKQAASEGRETVANFPLPPPDPSRRRSRTMSSETLVADEAPPLLPANTAARRPVGPVMLFPSSSAPP